MMTTPLPILDHDAPEVVPAGLDELWFQVAGTLCNLTCRHCFISCSPHKQSFGFMTLAEVERWLEESVALGTKEYYFTGGEPFLHPEMTVILEKTLHYGPATVLTNGTVFKDAWIERLAAAEANSTYSLEFRVSIDGFSPAINDPVRGDGTFARAMSGVRQLVKHGFLPIITATLTADDQDQAELLSGFVQLLQSEGYVRPRVKLLPTLRLGAEVHRPGRRGYRADERVTREMMEGFAADQLLCHRGRLVSDRGVHVCPILIEAADSLLGETLAESLRPYPLQHHACYTCWQYGSICSNPSGLHR